MDGLVIDPSTDGIDIPLLDDIDPSSVKGPKDARHVREVLARHEALDREALDQLPWSVIRPQSITSGATSRLRVLVDGERVNAAGYAGTQRFRVEYRAVVNSWLALTLAVRVGLAKGSGTRQHIEVHEELIRIAHVLTRLARRDPTMDRRALTRLSTARIATVSRDRRPTIPSRQPDVPGTRRAEQRKKLDDLKQSFRDAEGRIRDSETIQVAIQAALAARLAGKADMTVAALDQTFYSGLEARLSASQRALVAQRLGANLARRPRDLFGVISAFDVSADVISANFLCSRVRVYEDEAKEQLPSARPAHAGDRPSIKALGWGDLVVIREHLVSYDAREIAHIENVLAGEAKVREHERRRQTEELIETEETRRVETERDLQTSNRFELQSEAERIVATEFSVQAGVDTSGRYGLTKVNTSLDAGFQRSVQESQRRATTVAQEVIARSVENVQETVRELRRRVTIEELRELNTHTISNLPDASGTAPKHRSGLYLWVEKIHQLELRQYGTRLMVEFHIPEPGLTLIEDGRTPRLDRRKPADLAFGPQDISAANYMCLTKLYGAQDVEPPPALFVQAGFAWRSDVDNSTNQVDAEDTVAYMIKLPDGYIPMSGRIVVTGRGRDNNNNEDPIHVVASLGGRKVLDSGSAPQPTYATYFVLPDGQTVEAEGLPFSVRIAGHDDRTATANVMVSCRRSVEQYQTWQLRTFERILEGHDALVRDYEEARAEAGFAQESLVEVSGRPAAQNRRVERDELKKWAIKTMRIDSFDVDAVVDEDGIQEIDPIISDIQAPIVRFFEEAFEWREMSYFLYPYFWGRRSAWSLRNAIRVAGDPLHEMFLQAGAARVIVPVTPGFEDRVLQYLESDPTLTDAERIPAPADEAPADTSFPDLWLELLLNRNEELALGAGTLLVTNGSDQAAVSDGPWRLSERDRGRELHIGGGRYEVADLAADGITFTLDRPYEGATNPASRYAGGSIPFGEPWLVRIPTELVVLASSDASQVIGI
jgi:hypothetical protein